MKNINVSTRFFYYADSDLKAGDLLEIIGSKGYADPIFRKSSNDKGIAFASCDVLANQKGMALGFGAIEDESLSTITMNLSDYADLNELVSQLNICDLNVTEKTELQLTENQAVSSTQNVIFPLYSSDSITSENGAIVLSEGLWAVYFYVDSSDVCYANITYDDVIQYQFAQASTLNNFVTSTACLFQSDGTTKVSLQSETDSTYTANTKCIIYKLAS